MVSSNWLSQECSARKACYTEIKNFVFGKVGHDVLANNVFEQFSTNTCQGDRPVVRSSMPISLKTGATLASTHSSDNFQVRMECSKKSVKKGDISLAAFLRSKFGSSSGPGALSMSSSLNNLVIPDCVISILIMRVVD